MKPADASPVAGPILPARVVTRTRHIPDDPVAQRWPVWLLIVVMGIALFVCPALGFLALVMREASGLPWVLLGFLPGVVVGVALPLQHRYREQHPPAEPVPDEQILVTLDRLRLFHRAHGWEETSERESEVWLTGHGCYFGSGRLARWSSFLGYHIESLEGLVHRIGLRRRLTGRARLAAIGGPAALFGFLAAGPLAEVLAAVSIYHRYGMRADLLTAATAGLMLLVSLVCLYVVYRRQPGRAGSREDELLLSVDAELATRGELEDLLGRYLPRRR